MCPFIDVFGFDVGTYGICCIIGGALAILLALYNKQETGLTSLDIVEAAAFIIIGGVAGAKILYLIADFDTVAYIIIEYGITLKTVMGLLQGGFVFYGGFIGGFAMLLIYSKWQRIDTMLFITAIAPSIPLAHAFGRIGCFMAGCCYGVPSEDFGIAFTDSLGAPNDIKLFPVQLLESVLLIILAAAMQIFTMKSKHRHCTVYIYLFAYPIIRIFTERFRYDDSQRGIWLGISTSTWISIAIIIVGIILYLLDQKKGFPEPEPLPSFEDEEEIDI